MNNIYYMNLLFSNKGYKFFKFHTLAVIIFALLYWIQDLFLSTYPILSKKMYLGSTYPPADTLLYYMWFSLITQSTVGYGGVIEANGKIKAFPKIHSVPYKVINFAQLISIFAITAVLM